MIDQSSHPGKALAVIRQNEVGCGLIACTGLEHGFEDGPAWSTLRAQILTILRTGLS